MSKKDIENSLNRTMLEKQIVTKALQWKRCLSTETEKEYLFAELELIKAISKLETFEENVKVNNANSKCE